MTAHPGFDAKRLEFLTAAVERDIAEGQYFGGVISVKRGGERAYHKVFGHSSESKERAVADDSVFSLFSVTKAFTNILVFQAIERGLMTLTTPLAKIIPEFSGGLRDRITIFHLLTHSTGLPSMFEARPATPRERRRREVLAHIDAHLLEANLTAHRVACDLGISARSVQIIFAGMGTTPSAYIQSKRLDHAAHQLAQARRNAPITAVAFDAGFNDLSTFCRLFRRKFGVAPRDYRAGARRPAA